MTAAAPGGADGLLAGRLAAEDLRALAEQGFVALEPSASGRRVGKLRWRRAGRQKVLYLGSDPVRIQQVRAELAQLQRPRRAARELERLLRIARAGLKRARALLEPAVAAAGDRYHGYTRRRPAPPRSPAPERPAAARPAEASPPNPNPEPRSPSHE